MRHIVATRFGIGVCDPDFFTYEYQLMKNGLFCCLKNQTNTDFEWHVYTDVNIPGEIFESIKSLFIRNNFYIHKIDPVEINELGIRASMLHLGDEDDKFIVTRIDIDDLVSNQLIQNIKDECKKANSIPFCVSLSHGINLDLFENLYSPCVYPNIGLGISTLSHRDCPLTPYDGGHKDIAKRAVSSGGSSAVVETEAPMWAYVRRAMSDSGLATGHLKFNRERGLPLSEISEMLSNWGVYSENITAMNLTERAAPKNKTKPIQSSNKMSHISKKAHLLQLAADMRKNNADEKIVHALIDAVYAI